MGTAPVNLIGPRDSTPFRLEQVAEFSGGIPPAQLIVTEIEAEVRQVGEVAEFRSEICPRQLVVLEVATDV